MVLVEHAVLRFRQCKTIHLSEMMNVKYMPEDPASLVIKGEDAGLSLILDAEVSNIFKF